MDKIVVLLDGQQYEEPRGIRDFNEGILRDDDKRVITLNYTGELEFYGNAYTYLNDLFVADYCAVVQLQVLMDGQEIIRSSINLVDATFMLNKGIVTVSIEEPYFQQRVFNNYDLKLYCSGDRSIQNQEITPTELSVFRFKDPANGQFISLRDVYVVRDMFRWFMDYFTDSELTVESAFLDEYNETTQKLLMTRGVNIMFEDEEGKTLAPELSFQTLWEDISRTFNLWMVFVGNTVFIEPESALYEEVLAYTQPDSKSVRRSVDVDRMYGRIKVGGNEAIKDLRNSEKTKYSFPYIFLRAFVQEELKIFGICATDTPLDLERRTIYDVNRFIDAARTLPDDYDRDFDDVNLMFVCEDSGGGIYEGIDYDYFDWGGGITGFTITDPGDDAGYPNGVYELYDFSNNGVGYGFRAKFNMVGGEITSIVSIDYRGAEYEIGDVVTLDFVNSNFIFNTRPVITITTIDKGIKYNQPLLNEEIVKRYDLQGDVILNVGLDNVSFLALRNSVAVLSGPIAGGPPSTIDEEFPGNAGDDTTPPAFGSPFYNPVTFAFEAPVNDLYTFEVEIFALMKQGEITTNFLAIFDIGIEIGGVRTEANTYTTQLIQVNGSPVDDEPITGQPEAAFFTNGMTTNGDLIVKVTARIDSIYMEESETAQYYVDFRGQDPANIGTIVTASLTAGYFWQLANGTAGGNYQAKDQDEYYVNLLGFEGYMTTEQWQAFKANPRQRISALDKDGREIYGYVSEINRNPITCQTSFNLIFNRKQENI